MNNYVQPGDVVTLTAPAGGVVSGTAYQIGSLFVVAGDDAAAGESFPAYTKGVFTLPKTDGGSTAWTEGALLYWDDTAKEVTAVEDTHLICGVAVEAVADGGTSGNVLIHSGSGALGT